MKKTAIVLATMALSVALVGCNGGDGDDDCWENEAGGSGIELVAAVDGKSGGSSGGKSRGNSNNGKPKKGGKPGSSNAGVGVGVTVGSGLDDDCDDD